MNAPSQRPSNSGETSRPQPASIASPGRISSPLKAIGWAFLGIRGSSAREQDAVQVSPLVWIGVGIAAVVVLVLVLMAVVHWLVPAVA